MYSKAQIKGIRKLGSLIIMSQKEVGQTMYLLFLDRLSQLFYVSLLAALQLVLNTSNTGPLDPEGDRGRLPPPVTCRCANTCIQIRAADYAQHITTRAPLRVLRPSYGPATMQKMLSGTAFVCENDLQLVFGGSTILILLEL